MSDVAEFRAGQRWTYRAPAGFEASRLIIGAIVTFPEREQIVCCAVTCAPRRLPDGRIDAVTIPFLPLGAGAFGQTVGVLDGTEDVPADFIVAFEIWRDDPRGLSAFTVPFEGLLDRLIARQMEQIVQAGAA